MVVNTQEKYAGYLTAAAEKIGKEAFVIQFYFNTPPAEELRSRVERSVDTIYASKNWSCAY